MRHFEYLPSKSDWKFWKDLSKTLGVLEFTKDSFSVMSPDHQRFLTVLVRQVLEDYPPHRDEVIREIKNDYLQDVSEYEFNYSDASRKSQIRMISADLKELEGKNIQYIKIYKTKDWEENFLSKAKSPHGSAALYQITGRGVLAYESSLGLPILTMNVAGVKTGFGMGDSFINFGILSRPNRHKWQREYLDKHEFRVSRFHEKVLHEISEILGQREALFWQMSSPQVLLLREYFYLKELISWNKGALADDKRIEVELKKISREKDQWVRYSNLAPSNYSQTIRIASDFCEAIIDNFILPEWKTLGFSTSELERHLPDSDVFMRTKIKL